MHPFGTNDSVEKAGINSRAGIRLIAFLAALIVAAVLYFFSPAQYAFYPRCIFHSLTGLACPGCGALRAVHQLLHGNISAAFDFNPLFVLVLFLSPFFFLHAKRNPLRDTARMGNRRFWLMFAGVVFFTVLRNVATVLK
ncbi:MAG: DUF2752 domain-containing protein [Verrucomicrobiota bacterium]